MKVNFGRKKTVAAWKIQKREWIDKVLERVNYGAIEEDCITEEQLMVILLEEGLAAMLGNDPLWKKRLKKLGL